MSFNKILYPIIAIVIIVLGFLYFKHNKVNLTMPSQPAAEQTTQPEATPEPVTPTEQKPVIADSILASVETSLGSFEVTLNHKAAPKTVENFVKLANDGFYNNLTFHRISQDAGFHLIQGGDPNGNGSGGPGYTIPAEIGLKHTRGAIATARTDNPEKASSGSQFYITLEDIPYLDGKYTVFGYVTSGMDVVDKIGAVQTIAGTQTPVDKVIIKKITIK